MKVKITDTQALAKLSLMDVRAYLAANGWKSSGRYGTVATIFSKRDVLGRDAEILLPIKPELGDYLARMRDLIETLAAIENKTELSIFQDLIRSGYDVVRFRAPEADHAGTIAFENGVALYDHARDLVAACANAAIKPKRAYRGNGSEQAKGYLDSLRLGQTEIGSYVLTVLSPVPPVLESDQMPLFENIDIGDEPFPRAVTRKLAQALRATKVAVTEATATGRLDPFEAAVGAGVSSNLCDAIANLVERGSGVDITVAWSMLRPASEPPPHFSFTRENARILTEAAAAFREREPQPDVTIEGFVVGLQRDHDQFDGKAKIRGFVNNQVRTLSAQFILPDYTKVVRAHEQKLRVRIDGELVRRGQLLSLDNARNLVVFDDDGGSTLEGKTI